MSSLIELYRRGQSVWLDYLDRRLLANGGLRRLSELGVRGITSNPTIFHQAITASDAYDSAIRDFLQVDPNIDATLLYEWLTVQDVQAAADQLRHVYESSQGIDGYVSLEVAPRLAYDTEGSIEAARHLWRTVNRPNLMIKVPATREGVPAIERLIAEGINVNATLLFSAGRYEEVAHAFRCGRERCATPRRVASVASLFVSRVDTKVDRILELINKPAALALRGCIAVANARAVYERFREIFARELSSGERVQRPLWASTGTKNPAYRDVLYVEELIGSHTVTTLPQETLDAFLHHGEVRDSLLENPAAPAQELAALRDLGVNLDEITSALEQEGVTKFAVSYDETLAALREKRGQVMRRFAG